MTVPPPRERMAAVRVCLQKSHTVGGRPFPRISAHDHRRHGMQVRGVGEEEEFSPAAVVLVHVLHTSHCIIEPLERWWQSLITRSTCPLPRIIAWQRVSQSPHSNPSSSSPPDLRVRRSNAILGPHAIGMSSHASYTPSPFTLHSITPARSWSPSTCQIMERAASPERSTAAIYRIPTSRHPSTYPPYLHTIQCHHHAGL